jgi:hypothetical protein
VLAVEKDTVDNPGLVQVFGMSWIWYSREMIIQGRKKPVFLNTENVGCRDNAQTVVSEIMHERTRTWRDVYRQDSWFLLVWPLGSLDPSFAAVTPNEGDSTTWPARSVVGGEPMYKMQLKLQGLMGCPWVGPPEWAWWTLARKCCWVVTVSLFSNKKPLSAKRLLLKLILSLSNGRWWQQCVGRTARKRFYPGDRDDCTNEGGDNTNANSWRKSTEKNLLYIFVTIGWNRSSLCKCNCTTSILNFLSLLSLLLFLLLLLIDRFYTHKIVF